MRRYWTSFEVDLRKRMKKKNMMFHRSLKPELNADSIQEFDVIMGL